MFGLCLMMVLGGNRVEQAYIDRNLTLKQLCYLVVPICVYCRKEDVKII